MCPYLKCNRLIKIAFTACWAMLLSTVCYASSLCPIPPEEGKSVRKGLGKRLFQKSMRHELNLYGGALATDLMGTSPLAGIAYGFHFNEDFALELGFAYTAHDPVLSKSIEGFTGYDLIKRHDARMYSGNLLFHPIHGKFMFFDMSVLHFDLYLLAGIGSTDSHYDKGLTYNLGAGMKVFLNSWMSLRLEVRNIIHSQQLLSTEVISHDLSLTAGVGFWIPTSSIDPLDQ